MAARPEGIQHVIRWMPVAAVLVLIVGVFWWYTSEPASPDVAQQAAAPSQPLPHISQPIVFTDVTEPAGIAFTHFAGAAGDKWYPETIGSGVAFFDYDNDSHPDLLFVNGNHWPHTLSTPSSRETSRTLRVYRNQGDGTFTDVTEATGMAVPLYGMGVAIADYDNDGDADVFISGYLRHAFFVNNGNGTFRESTTHVGIAGGTWGAGAAFVDYDRDGWLDLVLSSYVAWTPALEAGLDCTYGTPDKDYCPVRYFQGQGLTLYRNQGDGTFADVTQQAGVAATGTRAFAPAIVDYDDDGWPDIFVASDGTPSVLFRNRGNGTFEDVGVRTGIVLDEHGAAYAGMGVDVAYPHNNSQLCIAIGNFVGEPTTLHCRMPRGDSFHPELYAEVSARSGIGRATLRSVTFGLFFFDADLDGWQDVLLANGHVIDEARLRHAPRAQAPQLFRNQRNGTFRVMQDTPGSVLARPLVGRGAAYADYDGDGDLDIVLTQNQGPAVLLRNDSPHPGHYLHVRLRGTRSNRDGIGAEVRIHTPDGVQRQTVRTGVSYFSQSTLHLTFGLGTATEVRQIEVLWPSGTRDVYHNIAANTRLQATEGETSQPLAQQPSAQPQQPQRPEHDDYAIRVQTGITAYRAKRYAEAAQSFESAVPLRPMEPLPLRYLADIYWRQAKHDLAAQTVGKLAQAMPDAYYLDRQGNGYEEAGLRGLAQLLYAEAVRLNPAFPSARFNLGRSYLEDGDLQRGITEIQEALRLHPTFAAAHETLGLAYTEQGRYDEAIPHVQQAIRLHPGLAVSRNHLGRLYMALGRFEEAIAAFQGLVQVQPEAAAARHNLAIAYARGGEQNKAVAEFRHALRLQPQFHAARFDLGTLLLEIGRPQEAITAFQTIVAAPAETKATAASVNRLEARYRLGIAYAKVQQKSAAIATFAAVVQAKPDHANAHVYLARLYYEQREFQRAWQHVHRAEALGAPVAELVMALQRVAPEAQ